MSAFSSLTIKRIVGRSLSLLGLLLFMSVSLRAQEVLVPADAVWKYLDDGSDQGTAWRQPGFDDGPWAAGPAQLGYGDKDEATVVSYGSDAANKHVTTWFRHTFNVADLTQILELKLQVLRDDGVVVYLNGAEVLRSNMSAGTLGFATLAHYSVGEPEETQFFETSISAALLVPGLNVLAAEVHQADRSSSDMSFALQLLSSGTASLTRGPYIQQTTPASVIVRWRTDVSSGSRVQFGTDPLALTLTASSATPTRDHEIHITGLQPETKYYYQVGDSSRWFDFDARNFFRTSPPQGEARPTHIWVLGDSGTASSTAAAVRNAYLELAGTRETDVWLMLGDNAYNNGTDTEYQAAVFAMYPTLLQNAALWPTLGDHDTAHSSSPSADLPCFQVFSLPQNGEAGGVPSGTEKYYSFDYGNIHFVCLDSMSSDRGAYGPMASWLRNDLTSTQRGWIIAYWHHAPYTKGSHDSDTESTLIDMRTRFLPILESEGVDLVLGGHSHVYERSFLLDGHYGVSGTLVPAMLKDGGDGRESGQGAYHKPAGTSGNNGTVYIVAGCGGLNDGGPLNHPAMCATALTPGSLVLDVDGHRLDATYLRSDGTVGDYFTILKDGALLAKPAAPGNLTATAVSANAITLAWVDNASNELAFVVERSEDNRSFAELASTGANATGAIDSDCRPQTTYYYRVRARNSAGSSAYTGLAQATTDASETIRTFVTAGAVWKYLANGSDQGTAWRQPGFSDAAWSSGPAQLGYGDGDESTTVSYGSDPNNKYLTTWFRRAFTASEASTFTSLLIELLCDDGAIVYLNGVEILRSNLPAGTVGFQTPASYSVGEPEEAQFFETSISSSLLVDGVNVLAVELHQYNGSSSDLSFDLRLTGITQPPPPDPTPPAAPSGLTATAVSGTEVNLSWTDNAGNEEGFSIERSTNGASYVFIGAVNSNVTSYADTGLHPSNTYYYRLLAFNSGGDSAYTGVAQATTEGSQPLMPLVPAGAVWKYRADGSDQGTAWRQPGFDDSAWSSGPAQLGYGDGDESTTVSYGSDPNNKYLTTWFRRTFTVSEASAFTSLLIGLLRDDGAIVYLNGVEVLRSNLPAGTIGFQTPAHYSVGEPEEAQFFETSISSSLLVDGVNVLAVEVHQYGGSSSDLSFDLRLTGITQPPPPDPTPPAAPSGLTATAVSGTEINLFWTDNAGNEEGFGVERSTNGISYIYIGAVSSNVTSCADSGLQPSSAYFYRLLAFNRGGESAYSAVASATTWDTIPPAPVTDLAAVAAGRTNVTLTWAAPGDDDRNGTASAYDLRFAGAPITAATWDSANQASGAPAPAAAGTLQNVTLGSLNPGTTYYFALKTRDEAGNVSPLSNVPGATTLPNPPAAPSGLTATTVSPTQINLVWTDNANNEAGFRLERSTNGASYVYLGAVSSNVTGYADTGLLSSTTYFYRLLAFNSGGDSAHSAVASATTQPAATATVTVYSVSSQDGYVTESTETSNIGGSATAVNTGTSGLRAGDTGTDQQCKTILSFNTATIPTNATIISATLRLKRGTVSGTNPFQTHGTCYADVKGGAGFGGSTALANGDYQALADAARVAILGNAATNAAWSTGTLSSAAFPFINRQGSTQFRVYFTQDDNDDRGTDYIGWYPGESASANRPRLDVVYR